VGDRKLNVTRSIKRQVIVSVVLVAVCSFFATAATYVLAVKLVPHGQDQETYVSAGAALAQRLGVAVLSPSHAVEFVRVLPPARVLYQVMDASGKPLYGSVTQPLYSSRQAVLRHLNTNALSGDMGLLGAHISKLLPVTDVSGRLAGAIYMSWVVGFNPLGVYPNWLKGIISLLLISSPILYMWLFTILFAKRFSKNINQSLQTLIQAAQKIRQHELDFVIDYQGGNELGQLLHAFEEMRVDLKEALLSQWRLEEERSEMLAAISHDLRTPVTIIQGHAEMLLEQSTLTDTTKRYADTIFRNAKRVVRLLGDFHTVTDIDSPNFSLAPECVDFATYIRQQMSEYEGAAKERDLRLTLAIQEKRSHPVAVFVDCDRLAQVCDNLMANALRFTPAGGRIAWQVVITDASATVTLHDSGPGFQGDMQRVFRKFYQEDASRTVGKEHAGLGLYIAKVLVEKHGGSITARNHPEGGAVLTFVIAFV